MESLSVVNTAYFTAAFCSDLGFLEPKKLFYKMYSIYYLKFYYTNHYTPLQSATWTPLTPPQMFQNFFSNFPTNCRWPRVVGGLLFMNVNAEEFQPKKSEDAVAEQNQRYCRQWKSVINIWFTMRNDGGGRGENNVEISRSHTVGELCLGGNPFNVTLPLCK